MRHALTILAGIAVLGSAAVAPGGDGFSISPEQASHWAFQPVRDPPPPPVADAAWATSPVDRFILARLEGAGLRPARAADPRTLLRRAAFDLTGLPPTIDEVAAFAADAAPDAFDRALDRLLASPRLGERWGRHWLDVARYADTKGYVFEEERRFPYSYTYRDYAIRAFNADLPFDRFILEQVAADLLPAGEDKGQLAAMGFLTLGRRFLNNQPDIIDDRIDVVTRGLLGLTVTCARCHDHKYDPIPTEDYYSLYGVFASSVEPRDPPLLAAPAETDAYKAYHQELQVREAALAAFREPRYQELLKEVRARAGDYLAQVARERNEQASEAMVSVGQGEINPRIVRRWKEYLTGPAGPQHPVFAPWHLFAAIGDGEFAAKAREVAGGLARGDGGDGSGARAGGPFNPLVVAALRETPPASLEDVARRYGELLARAEGAWREALAASSSAPPAGGGGAAAPTALADPALEELRQVLYAPGAPAAIGREEAERYFNRATREELRKLQRKVDEHKVSSKGAPPRAMSLEEAPRLTTPRVFLRGNPNNPGKEVPRQFLLALSGAERRPFARGSGRLELAEAIASAGNPLTARVAVNRVWLHHFGAGLVRTPGDFGLRGESPTHPELLDYLASRLKDGGWSLKRLHRLVMLSSAYRQASIAAAQEPEAGGERLDPENRLLWRAPRRRLDFEALRDSVLAVSGRLDLAAGGPSVDILAQPASGRRSVYGFIERQNLPGVFRAFDFASPDTTCPQRHVTTVPQQALFLMNSGFAAEQARLLAVRPEVTAAGEPRARVAALYRLVLARDPGPEELELGIRYVENEELNGAGADLGPWERYSQALLLSNEFAFLD